MPGEASYAFGPFLLDVGAGVLRRDAEEVPLTPKGFALLRYLVENHGRLLAHEELLETVWPSTFVGDEALKVRIRELRRALADDVEEARYIATVHRRGYRFVGEVRRVDGGSAPRRGSTLPPPAPISAAPAPIGRAAEIAGLEAAFARALAGERQTVFVSGEPGIGKTTLIEGFLAGLDEARFCVARGQCLELHGAGESYLPVLDALARIGRGPWGPALAGALRAAAPTWLAQLPVPLGGAEGVGVREPAGLTRERMLRELAEALEAFTEKTPLVLVLEDLHWSDASTLDLVSYLARRREPAPLLIVATYRPEEVVAAQHPLAVLPADLALRGWAMELPLMLLAESDVEQILAARLGAAAPRGLARLLHRRTEGSPLFLVSALDELLARRLLQRVDEEWRLMTDDARLEVGLPAGLRALLDQQLARLAAEERRVLEAASVVDGVFTPAELAAALGEEVEEVEERCAALVRRRRFLRAVEAGGAARSEHTFLHALHRQAVYDQVPAGRRGRLHLRLAEHLERGHSGSLAEHAATLAFHYDRAGQPERALPQLLQAARNATRRLAGHETLLHAERGLALLRDVDRSGSARQTEVELQLMRGTALMSTRGYGDAEVERALSRARELGDPADAGGSSFAVLAGLFGYRLIRAELDRAGELADDLLHRADVAPHLRAEACWCAGVAAVNRGDFAIAHDHLAAGIAAGLAADPESARLVLGRDVATACACFDAWALWSLGFPDRALRSAAEAEARARALGDTQALAFAHFFTAFVHHLRREPQATRERCDTLIALSRDEGYAQWLAFGAILRGWATAIEGEPRSGASEIRAGLAAFRATGAAISVPHFLGLLAEALARAGEGEEAARAVGEALVEAAATGGRYYEAELLRLRGELAHARGAAGGERDAGVADFQAAVAVAERQGAPPLALRAAMSWLRAQPGSDEAMRSLCKAYGRFTEGFDAPDLREAAALMGPPAERFDRR
jgi:DNA-binding winged helix-turn-helix (wHTH) protein/predicted ATPase